MSFPSYLYANFRDISYIRKSIIERLLGSPLGPPGRQAEHREVITEGEVKYNNGFVFLLISHDYRIPVKMVLLAASPTGCYSKTIANCTDTIIACANKHGVHAWCRATDGDRGV